MGLDDNVIDRTEDEPLNPFVANRVEKDVDKLKDWRKDDVAENGLDRLIWVLRRRKYSQRQLALYLHDPSKHQYLEEAS